MPRNHATGRLENSYLVLEKVQLRSFVHRQNVVLLPQVLVQGYLVLLTLVAGPIHLPGWITLWVDKRCLEDFRTFPALTSTL